MDPYKHKSGLKKRKESEKKAQEQGGRSTDIVSCWVWVKNLKESWPRGMEFLELAWMYVLMQSHFICYCVFHSLYTG